MIGALHEQPDWLNVSRETYGKLEDLLRLVSKWNKSINLVSSGSLTDGWRRHVLDSAQMILPCDIGTGQWVDIGSGAGFPGLVVAIIAQEIKPGIGVTLVESDRRKATFLSEAARQLGLSVNVVCDRIESLPGLQASVLSARAFAPLNKLLGDARRHLAPDGFCLFMKGQNHQSEIADTRAAWTYSLEVVPSLTERESVILKVREISDAKP